jgi:hypothetical protein
MGTVVIRDRFILATFPKLFRGRPLVLESSDSLTDLCSKIPEHITADEKLSVREVVECKWLIDPRDPSISRPLRTVILYELEHCADPSDEDEFDTSETLLQLKPIEV